MKLKKYFLFISLLLFSSQFIIAQTSNSTIKIEIENGKYIVSGVLNSESVKDEIVAKIQSAFGNEVDFSRLKIDSAIKPFVAGWQKNFDQALAKSKTRKSGVLIFSTAAAPENDNPLVPTEIMNAEILLTDNQRVRINDFSNKTVLLFLIEYWCGPCFKQAEFLRDLDNGEIKNLEIIGVSFETSPDEKENFRQLQKTFNFKLGWADEDLQKSLLKISRFDGIPQIFLIRDGKLNEIFIGGADSGNKKLKENILESANPN